MSFEPVDHEAIERRRRKVVQLREAGLTYEEIRAQEVADGDVPEPRPLSTVAADWKRYTDAQRDAEKDAAGDDGQSEAEALELSRLDKMTTRLEQLVRAAGRKNRCGTCGRVEDPLLVIKLTDQLLKIANVRAEIRGLKKASTQAGQDKPRKRTGNLDELEKRRKDKARLIGGDG